MERGQLRSRSNAALHLWIETNDLNQGLCIGLRKRAQTTFLAHKNGAILMRPICAVVTTRDGGPKRPVAL